MEKKAMVRCDSFVKRTIVFHKKNDFNGTRMFLGDSRILLRNKVSWRSTG
jgi:hypothetical protein